MKRKIAVAVIFFSLWTLLVLYPNPYRLMVSGARMKNPAIDPAAVSHLLERLPETPKEIERYVLSEIVPYQYDWQSYGVPFYFPRVEEVLATGRGDCKSRFVVLASIYEALGIPYEMNYSLSHFWISYEGKTETRLESASNAFFVQEDGSTRLQLPRENLQDTYDTLKGGFWDAMPAHRQGMIFIGPPLSLLIAALSGGKEKSKGRVGKTALVFSHQLKLGLKDPLSKMPEIPDRSEGSGIPEAGEA